MQAARSRHSLLSFAVKGSIYRTRSPLVASVLVAVLGGSLARADEPVDFNRDVRPILVKNCLRCHGPDATHREAGLRLDEREAALLELDSGATAIVPGDPANSELLARVTSDDEFVKMPPPETRQTLTADQIETLRRWIEQGAPFAKFWSFEPPVRPELPAVSQRDWARNPIDLFVLRRIEQAGLSPAPEADRHALVRRLSLDLRGLPPTPREVDEFIADDRPDAYERLVARFLDDPAFGERWARVWLDLARYADSRGYGSDPLRTNMWRYRDWVIDAFNRNLPYDQFTLEQLAGDLLPDPTLDQRMATAFHRNTMTNTEGGTDDEEFRVAAVKDRAETTIKVWMGLTMQCANCHDHKYDPISQRDYYQFYAIFNQTSDADRPDESPTIPAPTELTQYRNARIDQQIAAVEAQVAAAQKRLAEQQAEPAETNVAARFVRIDLPGKQKILSLAEVQVFHGDQNLASSGQATQSSTAYDGPPQLAIDGETDGAYFDAKSTTHTNTEDDPWWEVDLGEAHPIDRVVVWNRTDGDLESRLANFRVTLYDTDRKVVFQKQSEAYPDPQLEMTPRPLNLLEQEIQTLRDRITQLNKSRPQPPTLPVMQELPEDRRRANFIMVKGNFLSPGDAVQPDLPESLSKSEADFPPNRLGVARWLVASENPLTARVAANRFWARLFGLGLVETEEDFGTQGELPSHPELLDWLADELVRTGWDMKHLLRTMVTSATYRQSSRLTPESLARDPRNQLLSHAPRFRLDAETIRDQALALSGLLSRKLKGESVYPYQPQGLWRAAFNGQRTWPVSKGEDRFRRGLYTFWRRTVPYPSMQTFDAPSRELCTLRRIRTNTPLQALVTLNDPVYVEAAQALARRLMSEGGATDAERVSFGLRLCLSRPADEQRTAVLVDLYREQLAHFQAHLEEAQRLATDPLGPVPDGWDAAEAAAWTVVANVLLNLDGVLVKG